MPELLREEQGQGGGGGAKGDRTKDISSPVGKRACLSSQEVICGLVEKLLVAFQGSVAFNIHLVLEFKSTMILNCQK